ncbi:hypothetical protein QEN19_000715 [Hanseniaspora menglaensis]
MSKFKSYDVLTSLDFNGNESVYTNNIISNDDSIFTSTSNGFVYKIDSQGNKKIVYNNQSKSNIQNIKPIENEKICVTHDNWFKVVDLNTNTIIIEKQFKERVHSMDTNGYHVALGFELTGSDAPIRVFDIRKDLETSIINIVQSSHNDDITSLCFQKENPNLLLSGSVDGTCNLYDLSKYNDKDLDEEVIEEVITLDSVHKCRFISKFNKRIGILTHTEQFGTYNIMSESEDKIFFGDLREPTKCKYIMDFNDDYIIGGDINESKLSIYNYDNKGKLKKNIEIVGLHGNEVIRDYEMVNNVLYTCGEDGKVWVVRLEVDEKKEKIGASFSQKKSKHKKDKKKSLDSGKGKISKYNPY